MKNKFFLRLLAVGFIALASGLGQAKDVTILNVSYDVTREFYQEYNPLFAAHWKEKTGDTVTVNQSHGGSSKQARAVIDGQQADVVTMNQQLDIDAIQERSGAIVAGWAARLPNRSVPYTSTILFLVRRGNPRQIKDWDDLARSGVSVIIPNPKTSGNGRYSYLAAWGYALKKNAGDEEAVREAKARKFVGALFANVPVLDTGGRGATTTFVQREIGDVLLTFENEVALIQQEAGPGKLQVVVPSVSIRADNPVAWVDKVVAKRGTTDVARGYLEYLYSDAAQELAARHHFRPQNAAMLAKFADRFPPLELQSVEEVAGSWAKAQKVHFADGGWFDQLYQSKK